MTQDHPLKAQSKMVFDDYAKELGVSPEELGHATAAGCNEEVLDAVRNGIYVYVPCAGRGKSSSRANSRSLMRAGVFRDIHKGLRPENIDWRRVDELLTIRNRIKPDPLPPTPEKATPENPQVPNNSRMNL